jgi:hypothetical protein
VLIATGTKDLRYPSYQRPHGPFAQISVSNAVWTRRTSSFGCQVVICPSQIPLVGDPGQKVRSKVPGSGMAFPYSAADELLHAIEESLPGTCMGTGPLGSQRKSARMKVVEHLVFLWLGREVTVSQAGTSAILGKEAQKATAGRACLRESGRRCAIRQKSLGNGGAFVFLLRGVFPRGPEPDT